MFNEEDRKWLYGQFKDNGYDTGSYEDFVKSLDNDEDFKWWHEQATGLGLEVGDLNEFGSLFRPTTGAGQEEQPAPQPDPQAAAEGRAMFNQYAASRRTTSSVDDAPQSTQQYMEQNPVQGGKREMSREELVERLASIQGVNQPIIDEYEARWADYQSDIDNELSGPDVEAKKKWLDEHNAEYRAALQQIGEIEGEINLMDQQKNLEAIEAKKAENQKHVAPKAFSTTGTGYFPTQGQQYDMTESAFYEAANNILDQTAQAYKQGSKYDPGYKGDWLEQVWTAARQFVEGGANNFDMGSLTFGLTEGSSMLIARRVGDKSNQIVNDTLKELGYTDKQVNGLLDSVNEKGKNLSDMSDIIREEYAALESMKATIDGWNGSQAELQAYIAEYQRRAKEFNKSLQNYNTALADYEKDAKQYETIMSAVGAAVESGLSDGEKAVLDALQDFTTAKMRRAKDVSIASAAGAGAEQSAEFMLDFILTGGLEKASTKLVSKWLLKGAGKELGFGGRVLADVISSAGRTAVMLPRNLAAYGENLVQMTGGVDNLGRYQFDRTHLNAALNTALNQYIEYWSEGFGEYFAAGERAAFKRITGSSPRTTIGKTLSQYRGNIGQYLDHGKFNGMFNEMLEEVVGAHLDALAGWMSGDRVGDKDAIKNFYSGEQMATLALSFLPMSAISAGTNIRAYNKMKERYDNAVATLNPFLNSDKITREELDELVSNIADKTPQEITAKIVEITDNARKKNGGYLPNNFAQSLMGYVEGTFAMSLNNETWENSQEKMGVVNAYTEQYANPDERNAYDLAQLESEARAAAESVGFDENMLELDPYSIARHAQALQQSNPAQAQVLLGYAAAKSAKMGLKDGYDAETTEYAKKMSDAIEQKCDINGNVIRATLADGSQVFITSKDASVGADGKLNTPTGADGLVSYIAPDGRELQAKASAFTGATAQDTTLFLIESEDSFKQSRDLIFERAQSTISPAGKARALNANIGNTVFFRMNGIYEPMQVDRITRDGTHVVVSGDAKFLNGLATMLGLQSPGGQSMELPIETIWPMLATNDDGSLATNQPEAEVAQPAEAPASPQAQSGAAMLDGRPIGDIRLDEENGWAYFTYQDDPNRMMQVMDIDEFRHKTGQSETPAAPAEQPQTPAVEEAPAEETPAEEVPQSKIPVDKNGNKIYDAPGVEPIDAYEDMYSTEGLSEEDVDEWVISQSDEAEKNRNPKIKKGQSLADWGKEKAEANRKADFWKELREVAEQHTQERKEQAQREAELQKEIEKYGVDTRGFDLTPQTVEEAVAEYLGNNEGIIDLDDAKKEVFGKSGRIPSELFRHVGNGGILTKKGGRTIADVANDIVGEYEGQLPIEQDAVRDLIIDYLSRYTKTEMRDMIFNNRLNAALAELEQQNGASEEVVDDLPEAEESVEVQYNRKGRTLTAKYTIARDEDGFVHINSNGSSANMRPEEIGLTAEQMAGPKEEYNDEAQWKDVVDTINEVGVRVSEAVIRPDGTVEVTDTSNGLPPFSDAISKKIAAKFFPSLFTQEQLAEIEATEIPIPASEAVEEAPEGTAVPEVEEPVAEPAEPETPAAEEEPQPATETSTPETSETPENSVPSQKKGDEIAAGTQAVVEIARQLGFTPVIIRSINDIPEYEARARQVAETQGLDTIRAWVNTATGQVFVVDGNISEQEAAAIVQHEIVAHIGLPQLLGEEDYNALCDAVWDGMSEDDSMLFGLYALGAVAPATATTYDAKMAWAKSVFEQFSQEDYDKINSPAISRKAAGEYMASLAERETFTEEDKTVWQRIKDAVRVFLARVKIGINNAITDEDIRTLIRASREALSVGAQTEAERDEAIFLIPESALSQGDKDRMLNIMEQAGVVDEEMRDARRYLSGENMGLIVRASYLQAKQKALEYVRSRPSNLQQNSSAENAAQLGERTSENQGRGSSLGSRGQTVGVDTTTGEDGVPGESDTAGGNGGGNTAGANGEQSNSGVSGNGTESVGKPASGKQSGGSSGTGGNGQKSGTGRARGQKGSGTAGENTSRGTDSKPDVATTQAEVDSILDALDNLGSDATQFALRGAPTAGKLNTADRKEGVITLEGKSPEQISLIAKLGKALAKAGVALIQSGVRAFNLWHGQMKSRFGQKLKDNKVLRLTDEQVDNYINEIWETDFEIDGRVLRVREWADEIGREALRNVMRMTEAEKRRLQKAADGVVPVIGDMANIREMLPFLLPEQQEDVLKAETQFFDKSHADKEHGNGKGYLFTNATGTGKTFTGAGIIKRFVKSGKGRVLIVTPTQNKVSDWISEGARLDLQINGLVDTNDVGEGVVATTYSNFAQNEALMNEDFDLIVYDESHNITRSIHGQTETARLKAHFQLANKDVDYAMERLTTYSPFFRELHDWEKRVEENQAKIAEDVDRMNADGPTAELSDEVARLERENRELQQRINEAQPRIPEETEKLRPRAKAAVEKTKVVFLSASAFATHASLHYAEGFIFSFPDVERVPVGTDRATLDKMKLANFLVQRFPHGYRRKNQTTVNQVVSDADRLEEEEVAFTEYLFSGLQTASGRTLTTEYDYARKFPPLQLDMADRINSAENAILTDHELAPLKEALKKTLYDYNYGNALLETMKATLIIPYIRQFVAKGKKVVIFHSRLTSREPLQPPFERILELSATLAENNPNISTTQLMHAQEKFGNMFADVLRWEQRLNYQLPREQIAQALGADNVMLYSGQETPKTKEKNVGKFQDDNSGKNIIIVQTQSGSEGISLHDKTGKYPRVTINLSLPRSPIVAIQGEGRTLRIGSKSNAIFWYPLLGLEFERQLFATIFAGRAGTQENLSMGPMARGLRNSFMNGILEHSGVVDMNEDSGGKAYDAKKEAGDSTYEDAVRDYHESQASPVEGEDNADGLPTPEPLGFKMVQWAGLIEGESVLEPSAGRGAIARFVTKKNKLKGMDSNSGLVSRLMLKLSGGGRSFEVSRFEDYDIHNKHDVVLMNPPTGAEGLNTAYLHLSKAFKHLVEGGRIVAVVPADTDIKDMDDAAVLSGEVTLPTIITGQRGPMKVLVIDKVSRKGAREKFTEFNKVDLSNATTIEEFFARLRDVDMPARKIDESAKVEKAINTLKKAMKVEGKKGIIREDRTPWVPEVRPVKKKDISYWKKQLPGVAELDDDAIVGFSVVFLKQRNGYTYQLGADGHEGEFVIASPIQTRKELLYVRGRINSMSRAQDNGNLRRGADHTLEFYQKVYDVMLATAGVTEEDMDSKWFELGELTPEEAALRDRVYASTDEEIEALDQYYYDIYRANSGQKERQAQRMRQIIDKAKKDLYDGSVQRRKKESDWKSLGALSESEKQLRDRLRDLPLMQIKAAQQAFDTQLLDIADKESDAYRDLMRQSKIAENVHTDVFNEVNDIVRQYGYELKRQGNSDGLAQLFRDFSTDSYNSALFEKLLPIVSRFETKVLFTDIYSDSTLGSYNSGDNQLLLNATHVKDRADMAVTILHELIHDATTYAQHGREKGTIDANSDLGRIAARASRLWQALLLSSSRPAYQYPLTNDRELLAGLSHEGFRQWLKSIDVYVDNATTPSRYSLFAGPSTAVRSDALTELEHILDGFFEKASFYEHSHINVPANRNEVHQHGVESERSNGSEDTLLSSDAENPDIRFREETDADVLERLDSEPKVTAYRAMQFVPDPNGDWQFDLGDGKGVQKGFLYPPMSAKVNGEWRPPVRRGIWERSVEQPELAREDGTFWLDRGDEGGVWAAYNPYFHSSGTMLNDQFKKAQSRDNLVVVEVEIPEREVSASNMNPYHAEKAKDHVGQIDWNAGVIQKQLTGTRPVYLSRWDRPVEIVPVDKVADNVAAMVKGQVETFPTNVVWPQLRAELEKRGIKFVETDNKGNIVSGKDKGKSYGSVYGVITKEEEKKRDRERKNAKNEREAARERILAAEREATNATLDRMSEELGIQINRVPRTAMPIGHKTDKGYYNPSTGEMTICMDNARDERDAIATVLHETVGHHGLRKLFGDRFRDAMVRIYAALDEKGRTWVNSYIARHPNADNTVAVEEYLAHLAESGRFKNVVWQRIKEIFGKIVDALFGTKGFLLTDNELNYILRASYENLKNPNWINTVEGRAFDTLLKRQLGINETDPNKPTDPDGPGAGNLYRDGDTGVANDDYNREMEREVNKALTETQDADRPVKIGMDKVMKEKGIKSISEDEDYLVRHNIASSRAESEAHEFELFRFTPLMDQVRAIQSRLIGRKATDADRQQAYERILDYMYAVSGLERNAYKNDEIEQAKQAKLADAAAAGITDPAKLAEIAKKYDDMKRDWSGITSLMGMSKDNWQAAEAAAQAMIDAFKREIGDDAVLDELWNRVRACTDFSLEHAYQHGLLTREEFERLHGTASQPRMWDYYLPLRGFSEPTAEEQFSYENFTNPSRNSVVVKKMNGRWTQADNPLANILNIAETEIVQGNDNWAKQALYRFALNAGENSLLTASEPWYVKNPATGKWSLAFPDPGESLEEFEARMKALRALDEPLAKKGRRGLKLDNIVANKAHRDEHAIHLKVGGIDKMIWVNGNPALAKAVSGIGRAQNLQLFRRASRALSNLFTTYSLDFTGNNLIRDMVYSNIALYVKEDKAYRHQYYKNWIANFGYGAFAFPMVRLAAEWESGKLQQKEAAGTLTKREQDFLNFMRDGGQTGYTIINSVNQIKKDLERQMRSAGGRPGTVPILGWYAKAVKTLNEGFELLTRFTAYQTSRDMGRSGQRAAYDAKEISVNFNRRGAQSGEGVWGNIAAYLGATHYFFNAGVQGLDNLFGLFKKNPVKMSTITAGFVMMGVLTPLINSMLAGLIGGGDGDDDWYWNLPEWVRRNNIVIGTGKWYLAIPLPVEFRAPYGIGDIAGSAFAYDKYANKKGGWFPWANLSGDIFATASSILPVNPVEGYTSNGNIGDAIIRTVAPDAGMFFVDWATNRDYTGRPLWKENPFSETVPRSQGAYASTPKGIVAACQKLAEVSNGAIDIAPGVVRDFMNNYGGGFFRAAEDVSKLLFTDEERPRRWDNVPFFSGFTGHIDEDRSNSFAQNALYDYKKLSEDNVKGMNAILNTDEVTSAVLYDEPQSLYEREGVTLVQKAKIKRMLDSKDYALGKMYREGMNNTYKMKQSMRDGHWYKSRKIEKKGVNTLRQEWKDLRDEWAKMPDKTEEQKSAKAEMELKVQDAWHRYYDAQTDLAEKLMDYEYNHTR